MSHRTLTGADVAWLVLVGVVSGSLTPPSAQVELTHDGVVLQLFGGQREETGSRVPRPVVGLESHGGRREPEAAADYFFIVFQPLELINVWHKTVGQTRQSHFLIFLHGHDL